VLLWQGRWQRTTRLVTIAANLFSVAVLGWLLHEHNVWLAERGIRGLLPILEQFSQGVTVSGQVLGMSFFQLCFAGAIVVTLIEIVVQLYRLARGTIPPEVVQHTGLATLP
jgi:hypothetical protein